MRKPKIDKALAALSAKNRKKPYYVRVGGNHWRLIGTMKDARREPNLADLMAHTLVMVECSSTEHSMGGDDETLDTWSAKCAYKIMALLMEGDGLRKGPMMNIEAEVEEEVYQNACKAARARNLSPDELVERLILNSMAEYYYMPSEAKAA